MKVVQRRWSEAAGWSERGASPDAQLVLVFGGTTVIVEAKRMGELRSVYPKARLFGCPPARLPDRTERELPAA